MVAEKIYVIEAPWGLVCIALVCLDLLSILGHPEVASIEPPKFQQSHESFCRTTARALNEL